MWEAKGVPVDIWDPRWPGTIHPGLGLQEAASRMPRAASLASAKRRRSLSPPSISLYGLHSPQSKAATELTSQDGGNRWGSNFPNCVLSSSPCQPPSRPPSATKGLDSLRQLAAALAAAARLPHGAPVQTDSGGHCPPATFKAHKLLI